VCVDYYEWFIQTLKEIGCRRTRDIVQTPPPVELICIFHSFTYAASSRSIDSSCCFYIRPRRLFLFCLMDRYGCVWSGLYFYPTTIDPLYHTTRRLTTISNWRGRVHIAQITPRWFFFLLLDSKSCGSTNDCCIDIASITWPNVLVRPCHLTWAILFYFILFVWFSCFYVFSLWPTTAH
jgi:hypothetical protein